jgi:hypothetical protein
MSGEGPLLSAAQQTTVMSDLVDQLLLTARCAGISNMAMAVALQVAAIQVAKIDGISDESLERGFSTALEDSREVVSQALRQRQSPH